MASSVAGVSAAVAPIAVSLPAGSFGSSSDAAPNPIAAFSFAALPATYAGFGINGQGIGTVGIANNALAIVPVEPLPAGTTPLEAAASEAAGAATGAPTQPATSAKSDPSSDPPHNDPPPNDPPGNVTVPTSQIVTIGQLANVNERIAIANAQGQTGAVAQLQPLATQLTAQLKDQPFAGLGTTPLQPFAQPEIPPVFLNVAA